MRQFNLQILLIFLLLALPTLKADGGLLNLFEGHPSGSKKCDHFWPKFTDPKDIYNLFDPDWEETTIEYKNQQKTYFFNLIGIKHPKQAKKLREMSDKEIQKLTKGKDIALVPYAQDKKDRDNICHYAFRLKEETNTLVQIARVEKEEDKGKYERDGLLVRGIERNLKNLASALPELAPAIISSVQAGVQVSNVANAGMPGTQEDLQSGLNFIQTPAVAAAEHWANFFNKLLGIEDDEDWQVSENMAHSTPIPTEIKPADDSSAL
jgi:hypothetical protein